MAAAVHDDHWMRPLEEVYFSQGLRRAGIVLGVPREPHLLGSQARVQLNLDRRIPVSSVLVAQARPGKAGLIPLGGYRSANHFHMSLSVTDDRGYGSPPSRRWQ